MPLLGVADTYNLKHFRRWRQKAQKFKTSFGYLVKLAWDT